MKTMTTVEAVERTPSGAYKITLLPDVIAGTLDAEIGALAERLAGEENSNPVEVMIQEIGGGKLEIKSMQEITAPEELGGTAEPAPVVGDQRDPGDETTAAEPTLDEVIVNGIEAFSDEALLAEVARRLAS